MANTSSGSGSRRPSRRKSKSTKITTVRKRTGSSGSKVRKATRTKRR